MSKKQALSAKKPIVSKEMSQKAMSLRAQFLNLPKHQQDAAVHYFNLYNALGFWWNEVCDQDTRDYIDMQIVYARELQALEAKDSKSELEKIGVDTTDYNPSEEHA